MSDGKLLVQQILNQPKDMTLRLTHADWVEKNGDPEWAVFIRSCIAKRTPKDMESYSTEESF